MTRYNELITTIFTSAWLMCSAHHALVPPPHALVHAHPSRAALICALILSSSPTYSLCSAVTITSTLPTRHTLICTHITAVLKCSHYRGAQGPSHYRGAQGPKKTIHESAHSCVLLMCSIHHAHAHAQRAPPSQAPTSPQFFTHQFAYCDCSPFAASLSIVPRRWARQRDRTWTWPSGAYSVHPV